MSARDLVEPEPPLAHGFPIPLVDPQPDGDAPRNRLERAIAPHLADLRDLALVRVGVRFALCVPAAAVALYALPPAWVAVLALPYLALLYVAFGGPVLLAIHAITHRPLSRRRGVGRIVERVACAAALALYGIGPALYRAHHVRMHHGANNGPLDASSTLAYRRDDWRAFVRYWMRFTFAGHAPFVRALRGIGRSRDAWRCAVGELAWTAAAVALCVWKPWPTLVVCAAPWLLTRFCLMAGNWAQHAFVQPDDPLHPVRNATVLVNATQNVRCFNDGYHAVHHRAPGLHWAEHRRHFERDWRWYAQRGVLVFDGVASQQVVWWKLMRRDLAWLADRLVVLPHVPATRTARVALLSARLAALPAERVARGVAPAPQRTNASIADASTIA
jgi:hypothetical protein